MLTTLGLIIVWLVNGCTAVFFDHDDEFVYALTCAHCIKGDTVTADINGKRVNCRVVETDPGRDLALLKAYREHVGDARGRIAAPKAGLVRLIGFPAGQLSDQEGTLTHQKFELGAAQHQLMTTSKPIQGGFSGGAVIQDDALVGIVTSSTTHGGGCSLVWHVSEAAACKPGQPCGLTDRLLEMGERRVEQRVQEAITPNFGIKELIIALIAAFAGRYHLQSQHRQKDELRQLVSGNGNNKP